MIPLIFSSLAIAFIYNMTSEMGMKVYAKVAFAITLIVLVYLYGEPNRNSPVSYISLLLIMLSDTFISSVIEHRKRKRAGKETQTDIIIGIVGVVIVMLIIGIPLHAMVSK